MALMNWLDRFKRSTKISVLMGKTLLHGLFPLVPAEIMRPLFTNARAELYVRELARLSDLSLQTVQDELAKLGAARLITSRSNGYHRFYRADSKHPLLCDVAQTCRPRGNPHETAAESKRSTPSRTASKAKFELTALCGRDLECKSFSTIFGGTPRCVVGVSVLLVET